MGMQICMGAMLQCSFAFRRVGVDRDDARRSVGAAAGSETNQH